MAIHEFLCASLSWVLLRPNLTVNRTHRFMFRSSLTIGAGGRLPATLGPLADHISNTEEYMKLTTYLVIAGAVTILFGLEFLLVPGFALRQYAIPTDPHNLMQARYFGGTLLAFGLVIWLARGTRDDVVLRAILQASIVGNVLGAGISA